MRRTTIQRFLALCSATLLALWTSAPALAQETPDVPPAEVEPTAPPAAAEPAPPPPGSRVSFDLTFPPEQGGGTASGSAGSLSYRGADFAVLTGSVEVRYQDLELKADQVEVNLVDKVVTASGNVILDQGPRRLSGTTLVFNLETKTGSLQEATAFVDPDFYFRGSEIAKTGDDTYTVTDGAFTSCSDEVPDWSFTVRKADVEVGGYARVRGAAMKVKKVPVFYWPYLLWPVKEDRTAGLLVPNVGYSSRRGSYLGMAYYQPLGQSYDTTLYADYYSKGFYGFGNELRYRPSEGTQGELRAYAIRDPERDEWRWKANLDHATTDLPWNMRGVLTVREYSDFDWFRNFERGVADSTTRSTESRGYLSGSWGQQSLNILVNRQETFLSANNTIALSRLPEVEYRLRPYRLFEDVPLFLQMESSLAYLSVDRGPTVQSEYGRFDLAPNLQLPVRLAPWLSLKLNGGGRFTRYGDSLQANNTYSGEALERFFPFASAELIGPSFSRIFDRASGRFTKLKHIIEPRWGYTFIGEFDDRALVPLFDEVDTTNQANVGRIALINRLMAKPRPKAPPPPPPGETPAGEPAAAPAAPVELSAREILSWEVSRPYSFDDTVFLERASDGRTRLAGPISSLLRFSPSDATSLTAEVQYSPLFRQLTSSSLSGSVGLGTSAVGLSWRTRWDGETGERRSDQVTLGAAFNVVPRRLRLQTNVVYDLETSEIQQQRYIMNYTSQCFGFQLEFRDLQVGLDRQEDFLFSLTLKNVGTFLDLTY